MAEVIANAESVQSSNSWADTLLGGLVGGLNSWATLELQKDIWQTQAEIEAMYGPQPAPTVAPGVQAVQDAQTRAQQTNWIVIGGVVLVVFVLLLLLVLKLKG